MTQERAGMYIGLGGGGRQHTDVAIVKFGNEHCTNDSRILKV